MAATCVVQPIDLIKTRMQLASTVGGPAAVAKAYVLSQFSTFVSNLAMLATRGPIRSLTCSRPRDLNLPHSICHHIAPFLLVF